MRHPRRHRPLHAGILVAGLERTFTTLDLGMDPEAVAALAEARARGVRCVLATGRGEEAFAQHPGLDRLFDGYVLEGGAIWGRPGDWHATARDDAAVHALATALRTLGVEVEERTASCSVPRTAEGLVEAEPARAQCDVRPNHDRIDVTPLGVTKGVGLRALLESWDARALRVVAVGDGENDADLFGVSDHAVAVANAAPGLQHVADEVAPFPASRGFAWLVRERLETPERVLRRSQA